MNKEQMMMSDCYLSPSFMVTPPQEGIEFVIERRAGDAIERFKPIAWNGIKFELRKIDESLPPLGVNPPAPISRIEPFAEHYRESVASLVRHLDAMQIDDFADRDKQDVVDKLTTAVIEAKGKLLDAALVKP